MRTWWRRLWYLVRRSRYEADLAEEMALHRELKQRALEDEGLAPPAAALAARKDFGSAALARDQSRDVWIWPWLQDIAQDVRFAARLLMKDRRFTLAAVTALALGIAANTTIFTFINTALFKDLPFDEPRQLVALGTRDTRGPVADGPGPRRDGVSYPDFLDWRTATDAFVGLAADSGATMNVAEEDRAPERLRGTYISGNAFDLLRVRPLLGRAFLPEDDRPDASPVIILSYDVWQRRYSGDPTAVGRTVRVNDVPTAVIGVMPARFSFPMTAEAWQPLYLLPGLTAAKRDARTLNVTGRLAPGVTAEQAGAALSAMVERLAIEHPETNRNIAATIAPPMDAVRRSARPFLLTLMAAVAFVLLIGCANVANLLLARAATRSREIAIRASLGATRWRIVRQLIIESTLLAGVAGMVGLLLSVYGVRYFGVTFNTFEIAAPDRPATPYWVDLSMDIRVFTFVSAVCLGSSLLFGLAPALHVSKTDVNSILKDGGRNTAGTRRVRVWSSALMVFELALTLMLLCGAGLLVQSFVRQYRTNLVIDTTNLIVGRLTLPVQKYATPEQQRVLLQRLEDQLASDPVIASATIATDTPLGPFSGSPRQLAIDGRVLDNDRTTVSYIRVGRHYFDTLGLRVVQGHVFSENSATTDRAEAVVNQRLATLFFAGTDAVGQRIQVTAPNAPGATARWLTIIGVVHTVPHFGPDASPEPMVYASWHAESEPLRLVSVLARGQADVAVTAPLLREDLRALDANLPLFGVQTLDSQVAVARYPTRIVGSLFGFLATTALLLATLGLFALTAQSVAQRTQEMGIRLALGARGTQVVWLFVRRTLFQLAIGLTLGLGGALATGRFLAFFLRDTSPRDPFVVVAVACLLAAVALFASFLPARRASRIDPAMALRYE